MNIKYLLYLPILVIISSCGDNADNENAGDSDSQDTTVVIDDDQNDTPVTIDISFTKLTKSDIPSSCKYEGNLVDANSWSDENGANYFIRTVGEFEKSEPEDEYADPLTSQHLYAYHYTEKNGEFKLVKETTDFVEDCQFDVIVSHVLTGMKLTDIDEDNIGEISFVYRLACTSDVSSSTQKLIMLENGDKYPLRGTTEVMGEGGNYEIGEEFDNAPDGFLNHAKQLWDENRTEYDFEL